MYIWRWRLGLGLGLRLEFSGINRKWKETGQNRKQISLQHIREILIKQIYIAEKGHLSFQNIQIPLSGLGINWPLRTFEWIYTDKWRIPRLTWGQFSKEWKLLSQFHSFWDNRSNIERLAQRWNALKWNIHILTLVWDTMVMRAKIIFFGKMAADRAEYSFYLNYSWNSNWNGHLIHVARSIIKANKVPWNRNMNIIFSTWFSQWQPFCDWNKRITCQYSFPMLCQCLIFVEKEISMYNYSNLMH